MIRLATKNDTTTIADIYNHYLGTSTMDLESKSANYYIDWIDNKSENEELWVFENQVIKAWGIIKKYSDREGYRFAAETSVYLDPDHLNQGIGTHLKKHLINRCKNLGYKHLVAKIWATNQVSIDYNLKLGYEIVGIQKSIGFIQNQWVDVIILQLIL